MFFSDASDWPLLAGYVCRIPRLACPELWLHCVSVREFFDKFPEVRNPDHPPWSGFSHFGPFAPPPRAQRLTASMESSLERAGHQLAKIAVLNALRHQWNPHGGPCQAAILAAHVLNALR